MFSSIIELGKFLGSNINFIADAYQAISELTSAYELHTNRSGNNILAFNSSPEYTTRFLNGEFGLFPCEKLQVFDFISTKVNASFSINEAAVELFHHLGDDLKELERKHINAPLIITGSGLGGYLAILSTLRLHKAIDVEESNGSRRTKRPICITFGSPLIGDISLQGAIAERPQWKFSFLNVVAKEDPVASFFSSNTLYKPFGTYLFCTEAGGHTAFEEQDSVLQVLDAMKFRNADNFQLYDYKKVLSSIRRKVLYRGISKLDEINLNSLRAGITLQLKEVGVLNDITEDEIGKLEKKQLNLIKTKNVVNVYEPNKNLSKLKISLTYMEWYMKNSRSKGGYYDSYKNAQTKSENLSQTEIWKHQHNLNMYWKWLAEVKDLMPQREGYKLCMRWLFGGTNYRRIVEPLDIAEYYKKGNKNYMNYRSKHYRLLEKWHDEEIMKFGSIELKRNKPASLTEDSCFWAHVEEALILLRDLLNGGSADIEKKLVEFEAYLMHQINSYSLSADTFLEGSSLMKWWNEYKTHKGTAYDSEFAKFMNNSEFVTYMNNSEFMQYMNNTDEAPMFNLNSSRAGNTLQSKEVGVLNDITEDEIGKMEKKQMNLIKGKNVVNVHEPSQKLREVKIGLNYLEWYMENSKSKGGYYDSYKNAQTKSENLSQTEIRKHQHNLNMYWKWFVEEKDLMPQNEGGKLGTPWLYDGTKYRRIVEPLDIARYYKKGNQNYMKYRPNHYKLLEKWHDDEEINQFRSIELKRNKAASVTEDSCFWAHVEEALILLRDLLNGGSANIEKKLVEFEAYLMHQINSYSVSADTFLEGSSLMKWWNEYKTHKGTAYDSEFAQYMNNSEFVQYMNNTYEAHLIKHDDNDLVTSDYTEGDRKIVFDYPDEDLPIGDLSLDYPDGDFPIGHPSWWEWQIVQFSS